MSETGLRILMFKAVADGYLLTFAAEDHRSEAAAAEKAAAAAIAALNPWQRRWLLQERAWWIADDAITLLARRLPALSELLDQWLHRPPDAASYYADSELGSSLAGSYWFPPAIVVAYNKLGLPPGATEKQVLAARRQLARRHHPDSGGDLASMRAINSATDAILEWLRRQS